MKKWNVMMLLLLACVMRTQAVMAQDAKEVVVVMSRNYTYEDPRWGQPVELTKGTAIKVLDEGGGDDYYYWPYPAANVVIPRSVAHVPGKVKGERYLVLTGTNVRLREGPSTKYGYYSYNIASSASVYHNQFITDNNQPAKDDWGLDAECWELAKMSAISVGRTSLMRHSKSRNSCMPLVEVASVKLM